MLFLDGGCCLFESVVASATLYAVVQWDIRLRIENINGFNKLIHRASNVVRLETDSFHLSAPQNAIGNHSYL